LEDYREHILSCCSSLPQCLFHPSFAVCLSGSKRYLWGESWHIFCIGPCFCADDSAF